MDLRDKKQKALQHILKNGDDSNLRAESWRDAKVSLWEDGLLERRIGDWAWVPTLKAMRDIG